MAIRSRRLLFVLILIGLLTLGAGCADSRQKQPSPGSDGGVDQGATDSGGAGSGEAVGTGGISTGGTGGVPPIGGSGGLSIGGAGGTLLTGDAGGSTPPKPIECDFGMPSEVDIVPWPEPGVSVNSAVILHVSGKCLGKSVATMFVAQLGT